MIKGKVNIVIGGQAGSESKGKLASFLAEKFKPEILLMAASPNAGHTAYVDGKKYVTYHLPVSWVSNPGAYVLLGPSSVINVDTLINELANIPVNRDKLMINPRAVIIKSSYIRRERENGLLKIGSTNQGVGIARSEKLMRGEDIIYAESVPELAPFVGDTVAAVNHLLGAGLTAMLESTQGFDLDLEHGISPRYCTSKMINVSMCLAEAGISPRFLGHVYGVIRSYPIRVNNREGTSGPYGEAKELPWKEITRRSGCPHEIMEMTTTTKLPRRIFEFSTHRFYRFCMVNRPDFLCLQFANYIDWNCYGKRFESELPSRVLSAMNIIEHMAMSSPIAYVGTSEEAMVDRKIDCGVGYEKDREETEDTIS